MAVLPLSTFPELPSVSVTYRQPPSSVPSPATPSPPLLVVGSKEKEKLLGSFTTLRNKFRNMSRGVRSPQRILSPRGGGATLKTYLDGERGKEEKEEEEHGVMSPHKALSDSGGALEPQEVERGRARYPYSVGRSDSFGRGEMQPAYPRHSIKRSGSSDTISSQSTLVPRPSLLDSDDPPLGIADLIRSSRPTLTRSRVQAHDKYRQHGYQGYHQEGGKGGNEEEEEGKEDDRRTIEGELRADSFVPLVPYILGSRPSHVE